MYSRLFISIRQLICLLYISVSVVKREPEKPAGVFDDTVVNFKEESTPVQFSTATSLSDLTILSDEPNVLLIPLKSFININIDKCMKICISAVSLYINKD